MNEPSELFTVLINRNSGNIRNIKNQEMSEYGFCEGTIVFDYLYTGESLTAADSCKKFEEDKSTISSAFDYPEDKGMPI